MINVQRRDSVSLKNLTLTPEGYLETRGVVAKVGVLTYYQDGKPFREFVPAETLFAADSMATLPAKPVTNRHPSSAKVDAKNATAVMRGMTTAPVAEEDDGEDQLLVSGVKVMDHATINDIKAGTSELSLGYDAVLKMTPGEYKGQRYDAVQVKRTYNHLAVVPAARAGHKARLRLDAAHNAIEEEGMELVTIKIDGKDVEVPKASQAAIETALQVSAAIRHNDAAGDDVQKLLVELKRSNDTMKGKLDAMEKAETDRNSEKAKADEAKRIDGLVKARAAVLDSAKGLLPAAEHTKLDALDNQGIMRLVLTTLDAETKLDGKSEEYVAAAFDYTVKSATKGDGKGKEKGAEHNDSLGNQLVHGPKGKAAGAGEGGTRVVKMDEAQRLHRRELSQLWKQPLNAKA